MKEMYVRPDGGNRDNALADTLKVIGYLVWIGGFCLGIYLGVEKGKAVSYFSDSSSDFAFSTALLTWIGAFLTGLFPLTFSEILSLLQKGNTIYYVVDGSGMKLPDVDVRKVTDTAETENKEEIPEYSLNNTQSLPFKMTRLRITLDESNSVSAVLGIEWAGVVMVKGILADIQINNIYGDTLTLQGVSFNDIHRKKSGEKELTSEPVRLDNISGVMLKNVVSIDVIVNKYVFDNAVHYPGEEIILPETVTNAAGTSAPGGAYGVSQNDFLYRIEQMRSSKEIFDFVKLLNETGDPIVSEELLKAVTNCAHFEKMYGNNYKECVRKVYRVLGYEYNPPEPVEQKPLTAPTVTAGYNPVQSGASFSKPVMQQSAVSNKDTYDYDWPDDKAASSGRVPEPLYCASCGKRIDEAEAIFCPSCGSMIERY